MIIKKILFGITFFLIIFSCEKFEDKEGITVDFFSLENEYGSPIVYPFILENELYGVSEGGVVFKFNSKSRQFEFVINIRDNSFFSGQFIGGIVELKGQYYFATRSDVYRITSEFRVLNSIKQEYDIVGLVVHDDILYVNESNNKMHQSMNGVDFTYQNTSVFISQILSHNNIVYGISSSGIYSFNGSYWNLLQSASGLVSSLHSSPYSAKLSGAVVKNDNFIFSYTLNSRNYTIECTSSFLIVEEKTDLINNYANSSSSDYVVCRSFILNNNEFFNLPVGMNDGGSSYTTSFEFEGKNGTASDNLSNGDVRNVSNLLMNNCHGAIQFENQIIAYNLRQELLVIITGSN
jgi:hypothetical protein